MDRLDSVRFSTCTLAIRFVQGFIFFSAGIRRFITNPDKLEPLSTHYTAYKLNHAMPGALFGMDKVISYILEHASLLNVFILLFTTTELCVGIALILGIFTRFFAFISVLLAVMLMIVFGWLGSTCLDEWTMSSLNFAIGLVLMISGGGIISMDYLSQKLFPALTNSAKFQFLTGLYLDSKLVIRQGIIVAVITIVFTVFFYGYLFNGITGPIKHRTSPTQHHISLSNIRMNSSNTISFDAYVDAGPDTQAAYIISIKLISPNNETVAEWDGDSLSNLLIDNKYQYSQLTASAYGLMGGTGTKARVELPLKKALDMDVREYTIRLIDINGRKYHG